MSLSARLDRFQRRHAWAGFPLAVIYKYVDDSGAYLAALIAYYAFVSLFPLLLILSTVLGYVLVGDPELQRRVLNSALHQFPVVGAQLEQPQRIGGGLTGLIVGIVGSLYGGLGVAQAIQYAMNTAWRVPRNRRPNPFSARGRSVLLLLTAGVAVLGTTVLSGVSASGMKLFGVAGGGVLVIASVALNALIFIVAFRLATARRLSLGDVWPGALAAAVVWQLAQSFGVVYVKHVVANASDTNGVFAVVLGLVAFLYVTTVALVICVESNVVRVDRLHPRSLLTPFTDAVELTTADRLAYIGQAKAQRMKGFEQVDVTFDRSPAGGEPADPVEVRPPDRAPGA